MPPKSVKPEMSAFERKRLENIAANQALLKDLSTTAQKIIPKPPPKPAGVSRGPRKKATPTKREAPRPSRTSSRLAGIEADSETAKRKAEVEAEFEAQQSKAKRLRVSGDLNLSDVVSEGKKWDKGNDFLVGIMRGAVPYQRTFTEDDVKETTDKGLKALREKMSGLELYDGYEPNRIKITPERIYAMTFHPTQEKPLIFAGDKLGNLGLFDASQMGPEIKNEDDDEEAAEISEPAITAFKVHSRTITSFKVSEDNKSLYSASYDSSIRRLDLEKGVAVEVWAPPSLDEDMPISSIAIPSSSPSLLYFSSLEGAFGRYDTRTPTSTAEIWQLCDKKIGGFEVHPLYAHLIATASLDRTMKIWDLRKMTGKGESKTPALLGSHESRLSVSHAAFSASGHVATTSYDDTIKIHHFPSCSTWPSSPSHSLSDEEMEPEYVVKHNNQTGRWVTILKPSWQAAPPDSIPKFVVGNMNRFVDVFTGEGEQIAQLGGEGITAVPAVAVLHGSREWVAGGTASGKLCLWM